MALLFLLEWTSSPLLHHAIHICGGVPAAIRPWWICILQCDVTRSFGPWGLLPRGYGANNTGLASNALAAGLVNNWLRCLSPVSLDVTRCCSGHWWLVRQALPWLVRLRRHSPSIAGVVHVYPAWSSLVAWRWHTREITHKVQIFRENRMLYLLG